MWALYLVSKCLPRVCMGGSGVRVCGVFTQMSAPRVHGWFLDMEHHLEYLEVCPACAWVVPCQLPMQAMILGLPRVCMGGSPGQSDV